jgi:hypothetical protein
VHREEQRLWSKICEGFDSILDGADTFDLAGAVGELVERTRHSSVSVWEWKELLDDLAERLSHAEDYAGLGDRPLEPEFVSWRAPVAKRVDSGFRCPGELCDRQVVSGLLDPTPMCRILDREMT